MKKLLFLILLLSWSRMDAPNMKYFIEWANKKINYNPPAQGRR